MMITAYDLEVFTPPCSPGALTFSAIARLQGNIAPVLPYLNAVLPNAAYNPGAPALVWKDGRRHIVFHADHLAVSNLEDRNAAVEEVDRLVRLVNQVWLERQEVEPSFAVRQRPTAMMLYKLLPGTNCRECGEATCWNFALKLGTGLADVATCTALSDPVYAGRRAELAALVIQDQLA